jgi:hypothetical protein
MDHSNSQSFLSTCTSFLPYLFNRYTIILIVWCIVYYYFILIQFGSLYFLVSVIIFIFCNLNENSKSSNSLSAYSVFNDNYQSIHGSLSREQLESELSHSMNNRIDNYKPVYNKSLPQHYERASKNANKPCICGSGKKYKNCCSKLTAPSKTQIEELKQWENEWT